ncbi:6-phosphogluconolactonase, cycloisomerase 2 family [Modestobacter sp. DSM 44400]|uniref:lactonase family protein n=1 Tax=Modestobacter sp. DSM 44400 TaxID=1550230 RepID=UPI00089BE871|nr:beta-propeller fold lactonase family protein [Modestobacter sp. DSM 44400]SDY34455.1 6-phosphogluconolactonase, cycloisomerase 2 family [Modestobacter sp. DSM 44400]
MNKRADEQVPRGRRHAGFARCGLAVGALLSTVLIGSGSGAAAEADAAPQVVAGEGAAFAMTNQTADNRIVSYRRAADGTLTRVGSVSTHGLGQGVDLDTQGALRLSDDHRFLYAPNPGSDDVTVFAVRGTELTFLQKVPAGDQPNSLALHDDVLYVLDGSVAGNGVLGFRVARNGTLTELEDSFRPLSSPVAVPGDVEFSPDGHLLLVTQKTTAVTLSPSIAIDAFRIRSDGYASAMPERNASHGVRPFSLAFRNNGELVVAESFDASEGRSALSSYRVSAEGLLSVVSGSVPNRQTDTCWVVVTKDGRYAYTANFGSGTISSYRYDDAGRVQLRDGEAASTGPMSQPVDLALSADGHYLYLLLRGTGGVAGFEIGPSGALRSLGTVTGELPVADGASGLAVY